MRLLQYLQEARKNPEKNPKVNIISVLEPYKDKSMYFIHFTDIPKLGINPQQKYDTPMGIYSYPLKEIWNKLITDRIPFRGDSKYVFLFKYTGDKYLDVSKYNASNYKKDCEKIYNIIKDRTNEDLWYKLLERAKVSARKQKSSSYLMNLMNLLVRYVNHTGKNNMLWNFIMRELGYDAVIDLKGGGVIHQNEPTQAVFFSKKYIEVIEMFKNKRYDTKIVSITDFAGFKNILKKTSIFDTISLLTDTKPIVYTKDQIFNTSSISRDKYTISLNMENLTKMNDGDAFEFIKLCVEKVYKYNDIENVLTIFHESALIQNLLKRPAVYTKLKEFIEMQSIKKKKYRLLSKEFK